MARPCRVRDLLPLIRSEYCIEGDAEGPIVNQVGLVSEASEHALVWVSPKRPDKQQLVDSTRARVIICDPDIALPRGDARKCLIKVANPQLAFARVAALFRPPLESGGRHPTAVVSPEATIDPSAWIGPFCQVGRCSIGAGSYLDGHVSIGDSVIIGRNVYIKAGARIGGEGFGPLRNESDALEPFPHFGGVLIEDNVNIGSNVVIDRGALMDTTIGEGTHINNLTLIGHNVQIGRHVMVGANSIVAGGSVVGDFTTIWNSCTVFDALSIGTRAVIGAGSVVTRGVRDGAHVRGVPAREVAE
jgi:UDP-3-O-[3-hydroxymyristoyl] glucosamine N-acyltransferase